MIASSTTEEAAKILFECNWDEQSIANYTTDDTEIIARERARVVEEFGELAPSDLVRELITAKVLFENEGDADTSAIQVYYDAQFLRLKRLKNKAITNFFVAEIDLLNLRTFAKVRQAGGRPLNLYITGGTITEGECLEVFKSHPQSIKGAVANMDYSDLLDILVAGLESGSLSEFENASQSHLVQLSKEGSEDSFGINMLFGWFIAKMEELRIVKTILTGKKFGKTRDELREELRGVI